MSFHGLAFGERVSAWTSAMGKSLPETRRWSLRLRLSFFFTLLAIAAWLAAAAFAWWESRKYIDEFYDSQQMLFAKRLASAELNSLTDRLPSTKKALRGSRSAQKGDLEDDALGFAVFSKDGKALLTDGENGDYFIFENQGNGFVNTKIYGSDDPWRIVWLTSPDGGHVVAVGQELDYRDDMAFDMLLQQLTPWLLFLPVLLAGMIWLLGRELGPLRKVARELESRAPEETGSLKTKDVPSEVYPLVKALNDLFARIAGMLARERAFISDAAHELRTPLAALRIQAEVAGLAADDREARDHALDNLLHGIDRCSRLVEQLLTLSRLEALQDASAGKTGDGGQALGLILGVPDWPLLLRESVQEHAAAARAKEISLDCAISSAPEPLPGYPVLISLVLRNLLDNAVKYTPAGGRITLLLERRMLTVANSGPGVPDSFAPRLGERFARPPGQAEPGSGLGLSIALRASKLNNINLLLQNNVESSEGGFIARLVMP